MQRITSLLHSIKCCRETYYSQFSIPNPYIAATEVMVARNSFSRHSTIKAKERVLTDEESGEKMTRLNHYQV